MTDQLKLKLQFKMELKQKKTFLLVCQWTLVVDHKLYLCHQSVIRQSTTMSSTSTTTTKESKKPNDREQSFNLIQQIGFTVVRNYSGAK
jgi:hypothetical protein